MQLVKPGYQRVVDEIAGLAWSELEQNELLALARLSAPGWL